MILCIVSGMVFWFIFIFNKACSSIAMEIIL